MNRYTPSNQLQGRKGDWLLCAHVSRRYRLFVIVIKMVYLSKSKCVTIT